MSAPTKAQILQQAEAAGWPVAAVGGVAIATEPAWRAAVARAFPVELHQLAQQLPEPPEATTRGALAHEADAETSAVGSDDDPVAEEDEEDDGEPEGQ